MKILAVETSCDDTAIAILEVKERPKPRKATPRGTVPYFKILSNIVSSQTEIHQKYGGVVPNLARRAHEENLVPVLERALGEARMLKNKKLKIKNKKHALKIKNIKKILEREPELLEKFKESILPIKAPGVDIIAVTYGPGLEPALWAGINFARALSYWWEIPLVGVDHMEGHVAANFLPKVDESTKSRRSPTGEVGTPTPMGASGFPAVCLAVSGGHTQLILVKGIKKYKLLGETVDDAAGEAFDKVARMLGLGFPGGPEIAKLAEGGNPKAFDFPRPMLHAKNYNFSFSGLKTAVLYKLKEINTTESAPQSVGVGPRRIGIKIKRDIAASFQQAVIDVLVAKTIHAAKEYGAKTVMLAGGVAANKELRKQLGKKMAEEIPDTIYQIPDNKLATDNAAMIAAAAYFHRKEASLARRKTLKADGNLKLS